MATNVTHSHKGATVSINTFQFVVMTRPHHCLNSPIHAGHAKAEV
jgi:hypothetical protein